MDKVKATLSWSLFASCPHCGNDVDLFDPDNDREGYFSIPIFNNNWEDIEGKEAYCETCKKYFEISEVEC